MPELPEVEIVTQNLSAELLTKEVVDCEVKFGKLIKNMDLFEFQNKTIPFHFSCVKRKGKYILFEDLVHSKWITVHLGMTGAFFVVKDASEIPSRFQNHQHVIFSLNTKEQLIYCDIRKFGDIRLFETNPEQAYVPFAKMGPDPLNEPESDAFTSNAKSKLFVDKPIKPSLLDSRLLAGVGNIYACEILFRTGIHPERTVGSLTDIELENLYEETRAIFKLSIEKGGSSVSDYVNSKGEKGEFQDFHQIYQKEVCSVCSGEVSKITQNKRSTFYCTVCQPFI